MGLALFYFKLISFTIKSQSKDITRLLTQFFLIKEFIQALLTCFLIKKNLIINSKYNVYWTIFLKKIDMIIY
jgi:hypothetical protein